MMLTTDGVIRDITTLAHLVVECELSEALDPAARRSFLAILMSQGLTRDDAHYSACELELDELMAAAA